MKELIMRELLNQNKIHNAIPYLVTFFLFTTVSIIFVNVPHNINDINDIISITGDGFMASAVSILMSTITFSGFLLKSDFSDGTLELLLSMMSAEKIILAKFFAILINNIVALFFITLMICLFYSLTLREVKHFAIGFCLLSILSSALSVLFAAIQCYFKSQLCGIFIMPLLIPSIVFAAVMIQHYSGELVFIMLGINCFILPLLFFFSTILIKNVYTVFSL